MRMHGISDLESSFIFNHYMEAHKALQAWDDQFQKVVDLANQGKSREAIDAYATLINRDYANLVKNVRNVNFSIYKLSEPRVASAFEEVCNHFRIQNPKQMLSTLSTERLAMKTKLDYEDALSRAVDEKILTESDVIAVEGSDPSVYIVAKTKIAEELSLMNREQPEFGASLSAILVF